jgi:hypothetical protein
MLRRVAFCLLVISFSSVSLAAHNLAGCWSGTGFVTLVGLGRKECSRIAIRQDLSESQLSMKMLVLDCPSLSKSWDEKVFEIRNGKEIWGGPANSEKTPLGWLEVDSFWFDEPVNQLQYIEYKAVRDVASGQLSWVESFANGPKIYWKIEAELLPTACEGLAP